MFAPKMFGVCIRYSRDRAEAEDNLQDGFIQVFKKIDQFNFKGVFEGWLRRVIVNVCLAKYRGQLNLFPVEDIHAFEEEWVEEEEVERISEKQLLAVMEELPPRYKLVFNMYIVEGLSHREIAESLNISEGTSKSNLARAKGIVKDKLRKILSANEENFSA
ncbi:sigma-70 family RNA polymerase sigma factor [Prolixibacteraceae bacterium JC049]|nr:sigma-70 family RNA polymerase sigma factor [Prolixibacteraceae bacterium JC049]